MPFKYPINNCELLCEIVVIILDYKVGCKTYQ
jgi:hypothetical protein